MSDTRLEKQYTTQISKLIDDIKGIDSEIKERNNTKRMKLESISGIRKKIKQLSNDKVIISEHAYLRFFERGLNIDLKQCDNLILEDGMIERIKSGGDGEYITNKGNFKLIVKNNVITTIII